MNFALPAKHKIFSKFGPIFFETFKAHLSIENNNIISSITTYYCGTRTRKYL